jgi:superfamily I DNA/RNA helicase
MLLTRMFQFQDGSVPPGAHQELLKQAIDRGMRSVKLGDSERLIYQQDGDVIRLLFAGSHDEAYTWILRNRAEFHGPSQQFITYTDPDPEPMPVVDGVQLLEVASVAPPPITVTQPRTAPSGPPPFDGFAQGDLERLGVPAGWVGKVMALPSVDAVEETLTDHLPEVVVDRLLAVALGEAVEVVAPAPPAEGEPASAPQFQLLEDIDEFRRVLDQPLEAWVGYLHPDQARIVDGRFAGPVKVTGSAGTGKTVVAMHRARTLSRRNRHVILTSFTNALCQNLERNINILCNNDEKSRIKIMTVDSLASKILTKSDDRTDVVTSEETLAELDRAWAARPIEGRTRAWLQSEFDDVFNAHGVRTWDAYREIPRVGRGLPLMEAQRKAVWDTVGPIFKRWAESGRDTFAGRAALAAAAVQADPQLVERTMGHRVGAIIVDEVQDLDACRLKLVRAVAGDRSDALMVVGDAGQRIYAPPVSLRSCGINVVGRSHVLRVNYRTTAQIRRFADKVNVDASDDLDEGLEQRRRVRSVRVGPTPNYVGSSTEADEVAQIVRAIQLWTTGGIQHGEIAVFVSTNQRADQCRHGLRTAGIPASDLGGRPDEAASAVTVTTLHRAKGLEFKAVVVAGASDQVIPSTRTLQSQDELGLGRERDLLYVGLTRARDHLVITWTGEPSRFLLDAITAPVDADS